MLKRIILTSLVFTIPVEILENTTFSTNITDTTFCPAHINLSEPICLIDEKSPPPRNKIHKSKDMVTAEEMSKLRDMMLELLITSAIERIEMVDKILSFINKSINESYQEIPMDVEEIRRNLDIFHHNVTKERAQLTDMIINFLNQYQNGSREVLKEIAGLKDMLVEQFNTSRQMFAIETKSIVNKTISFITQNVNESIREIPMVVGKMLRNVSSLRTNGTHEKTELKEMLIGVFQNESREILKLGAEIQGDVRSCRESIKTELTQSRNNMTNFIDQSQINLNASSQNLLVDFQKALITMQHHFSNETTELRLLIKAEAQVIKWIPVYVIVLQVLLVLLWRCKGKSSSKQQLPDIDISGTAMENSIAVVSFSEKNKDLHLGIAQTVASEFEIHQVYLGGMTNVSTLGLPSKVCLVFVDKNERNIILETDVDVSRTRASFVEGQVMKGRTQVIVIYCQHAGSCNLERLYDRSLGDIKRHETLRKLQGQLRVLSIDTKFSDYQAAYLKTFLKETLTADV